MADNPTRDMIEKELQRDLAELEGRAKPKKAKKTAARKEKKPLEQKATKKSAPESKKSTTTDTEPKKEEKKEKRSVEHKPDHKKVPSDEQKKDKSEHKEEQSDDDARSKRIFYGGIVAIIIIFAALLLGGKYLPVAGANEQTVTYNGYTFTKDQTHWVFDWQSNGITYQIPLRFNPLETEDVYVEGVLNPRFNKLQPIYITFDPTSPQSNFTYLALGAGELSFNLVQALGKTIEPACATNDTGPACANRTIVNCENSEGKAVIYLKTEEPAGIFINDTCITLQGEDMDLLRSIDRLLYNWYGIS